MLSLLRWLILRLSVQYLIGEKRSIHLINTPVLSVDVTGYGYLLFIDRAKHCTGATFDINNGGYLRKIFWYTRFNPEKGA